MPRYFFHTRDGAFVEDEIGYECDNIADMHCRALKSLADLSRRISAIAEPREVAVEVRDVHNNIVTHLGVQLEIRIH